MQLIYFGEDILTKENYMYIIIICLAICCIMSIVMFILYHNAPIGWEDAIGFHKGSNEIQ
jgi:hypothetical protein